MHGPGNTMNLKLSRQIAVFALQSHLPNLTPQRSVIALRTRASALLLSAATLALAGCGNAFTMPDSPASLTGPGGASASVGTSGSVYGGHAPIVNAKVYVLTPSTTANAGPATSLMSSTSSTTGGYPVTQDTSGGVTNGMYYVTTDINGIYNLTGDYTCTPNQPVYVAAVGGSPVSRGPTPDTFNIASVTVSNLAGTNTGTGTATYTFNISGANVNPELFYVGEPVIFSNVSIPTNSGNPRFFDSGGPYIVSATGLNTVSFQITFNADYGGYPGATQPYFAAGTYTQTNAKVIATSLNNPAIVNMAALGVCPSNGTFAGHIPFIFMNEISTAALAYSAAAFGTDAFHIGVNQTGPLNTNGPTGGTGYVTGSMVQAFNNASLLYDITGSNVSTTYAGEGHIGRLTTPAGNGTAPRAKLDTLGNILAACVDSANVSGTTSPQCGTLFSTATADGTTGGTRPVDISAAAFNIARFPAGTNNTAFVNTLFNLPTGNVPFAPNLTSAPNDFTLAIQFAINTSNGSTNTNLINNPQILSLDGGPNVGTETGLAGNTNAVWIGSYNAQPTKLFTNGTPDYSANASGLSTATRSRSVAVDSSNNLWIMDEAATNLQHFSDSGALLLTIPPPASPFGSIFFNGVDASIGASGDIYGNYEDVIYKYTPAGTNVPYTGGAANAAWSSNNGNLGGPTTYTHSAYFDSTGLLYVVNNSSTLCVADPNTANCTYTANGFSVGSPSNAIYFNSTDGNNTLWAIPSNSSTNLIGYNHSLNAGAPYYTFTGGGLNTPVATAVDGAGNIWAANVGNNSLSAFTPNGTALSPSAGFGALGGAASTNSADLAIDRCGDVWVVYSGYNYVYEMIGLATPTVSPTAFAVFNHWVGKRPL